MKTDKTEPYVILYTRQNWIGASLRRCFFRGGNAGRIMIKDSIKFKEEGAMMLMSLKIFVTKQHGKSREINAFRVCLVTRGQIPGLSGEEEGGSTQKRFHSKPKKAGTIEKMARTDQTGSGKANLRFHSI